MPDTCHQKEGKKENEFTAWVVLVTSKKKELEINLLYEIPTWPGSLSHSPLSINQDIKVWFMVEAQSFPLTVLAAPGNLRLWVPCEWSGCTGTVLRTGSAAWLGITSSQAATSSSWKKKRKRRDVEMGRGGGVPPVVYSWSFSSCVVLVSWPNPTVPAGFLFKPASSQFSRSSFWQRSAGTGFLLLKVRSEFAEGNYSSGWISGKSLKESSKCHTLILQGHVQSSVLYKVKHVITFFARPGLLLWNCSSSCYRKRLTWVLFKTSWLRLSKQAIEKTHFLAKRKACFHWDASACQETACVKASNLASKKPEAKLGPGFPGC